MQDRLNTLENVRQAGISVCAGGIIGLGEGKMDRVGLLHQVCSHVVAQSVKSFQLIGLEGVLSVRGCIAMRS